VLFLEQNYGEEEWRNSGEEEGRNSGKLVLFVLCFFGFVFWKKEKNLEKVDMRKKREDDEKGKKLGADGSLLDTMDMQSNC